jgi:hypothetical protein
MAQAAERKKLSHAEPMTLTAIAELTSPIGVGSGVFHEQAVKVKV